MDSLKEKLHNTKLHDAKIGLIHQKQKIGKLGNLFNRNHRHDEEHEQATDEKRTKTCEGNRFDSFFPERDGNLIKWYVDGRDYFWAVSVALEQAKETIYICDWWLSPELFLRRPPYHNQEFRLDVILKRKAAEGVKIFVIVYKEVEQALTCNSEHSKHALQGENVTFMRHPDHTPWHAADSVLYWAHHEKFIVIDYAMAFIGGLDLCFGRWDGIQHPLSDVHPEGVKEEIWPGQDFNNNRIMDFKQVQQWQENELSKAEFGRMPWHDVAMGVVGPCVYDIAEHFVLRYNFVKRDKYKRDDRFDWIVLEGREGDDEDLVGVQRPKHPVGDYIRHPLSPLSTKNLENRGTVRAQLVRSSADWSSGILTDHSIQNAYSEIIRTAEHFVYIENQFFITATGEQQSPIHNTIGKAIVDAVVRAGKEGRKFRIIIIIPAIPGFAGDLRDNAAAGTRAIMDYQYKSICRGEHSIFEQCRAQGVDPSEHIFFFNLRSYDRLNKTPGIKATEKKTGISYQQVQRAEAEEIMAEGIHGSIDKEERERDRHMGDEHEQKELDENNRKAMEDRKTFEAAMPKDEIFTSPTVAHHAMADSGPLTDEVWSKEDPESEIQNWIQEELYIHAKLLIADDRIVVCGSSNLNDRSQQGDHDSELSIVMEDTRKVQSTMNGQPFEAGYHATTLRRYLWREHMGLLASQDLNANNDINAMPPNVEPENNIYEDESYKFVEDPLSDELWQEWTGRADRNTELFRHLFHADPDNHIKTFEDYDRYMPPRGVKQGHIFDQFMPPEDARQKLDQIKGHLVWMPMDFLRDAPEMAERGLAVNSWTESVYAGACPESLAITSTTLLATITGQRLLARRLLVQLSAGQWLEIDGIQGWAATAHLHFLQLCSAATGQQSSVAGHSTVNHAPTHHHHQYHHHHTSPRRCLISEPGELMPALIPRSRSCCYILAVTAAVRCSIHLLASTCYFVTAESHPALDFQTLPPKRNPQISRPSIIIWQPPSVTNTPAPPPAQLVSSSAFPPASPSPRPDVRLEPPDPAASQAATRAPHSTTRPPTSNPAEVWPNIQRPYGTSIYRLLHPSDLHLAAAACHLFVADDTSASPSPSALESSSSRPVAPIAAVVP
ncbi:hypothetical protein G7046_g6307 [Stylonectria norvegica]|nr:hypothetical protein G7046_g6307 [Stylonectria norvegica]